MVYLQMLEMGSWSWVASGCSVQSGGDWAAHFNYLPNLEGNGDYTKVTYKV